ncbi:MAG: F0F1 ATP synthase subunit A [Gemmatimonadota bacterium]
MAPGAASAAGHQVDLVGHIVDHSYLELPFLGRIDLPRSPPIWGVDVSITSHVVMMWVASALLVGLLLLAFRPSGSGPSRLAGFFEVIIIYLRDEVVLSVMGERGRPFLPFILTVFFFILACNLIGLVPYAVTPTGDIGVTAALALVSFFATQAVGIARNGLRGYVRSLVPSGVPLPLLVILVPIEIVGLLAKPFALCIRLFANMMAGHVAILVFLSIPIMIGSYVVAPEAVALGVALYLFEIVIAFVQAFIFALLTTVFVSLAAHPSH